MSTLISTTDLPALDDAGLDLLFRKGRTSNSFSAEPVALETLRDIYDVAKFGPTQANSQPWQLVFLTSDEAKVRLLPHMSDGNRAKTGTAPVVAIVASDADFNEHMPEVFPHAPESKDWFGDLENRREVAKFNVGLQVGYLITTIRAFGLAAGPMTGFDNAGVDAEFFAGTNRRSHVIINIGHPGENPWFDRLPRRAFEDAAEVL
ncbi:MAG: malonic semialdehyde reductase [Actinomycetales bacterium]|nr:malonic semialdehyde reductase [Actinomycetales bacterium]